MSLFVVDPGLFTTVQDAGRPGLQACGMPPAGALDGWAYAAVNLLAGNLNGEAALEMTVKGGVFRFDAPRVAAIGGADMEAALDGRPLPNWSSFLVPAGSALSFGFVREGCRAYLAVEGGIDVPVVLGSRSTYAKAALGGFEGRALKAGDTLPIGRPAGIVSVRSLPERFIPRKGSEIVLRVLPGPQDDLFEPDGLAAFFGGTYEITNDADRMGLRLEGPVVRHKAGADIVSDAVCAGAVQVPGHGKPIVLLADRQTTGGYAKLGAVLKPDLSILAQGKPGDAVRFVEVSDEEAVAALRRERDLLELMKQALAGEPGR